MPSLKALKQRINSVTSTRKITSAMKMVATSYYRRYQQRLEPLRARQQSLTDCIALTRSALTLEDQVPALITGRPHTKKHLIIALGSSRGLCGSFNVKMLTRLIETQKSLEKEGQSVALFCLGTRLFSIAQSLPGLEKVWQCPIDYKNTELQTKVIATYLKALFDRHDYDACTLIYAGHLSALSFEPRVIPLFPFEFPKSEDNTTNASPLFGVEPDAESLLQELCIARLETSLLLGMMESKASEESTRMVAMENATKNADDMIRQLNITYNRTRQATITKELIEIISGAEAL